jgi:hypothetical protein
MKVKRSVWGESTGNKSVSLLRHGDMWMTQPWQNSRQVAGLWRNFGYLSFFEAF